MAKKTHAFIKIDPKNKKCFHVCSDGMKDKFKELNDSGLSYRKAAAEIYGIIETEAPEMLPLFTANSIMNKCLRMLGKKSDPPRQTPAETPAETPEPEDNTTVADFPEIPPQPYDTIMQEFGYLKNDVELLLPNVKETLTKAQETLEGLEGGQVQEVEKVFYQYHKMLEEITTLHRDFVEQLAEKSKQKSPEETAAGMLTEGKTQKETAAATGLSAYKVRKIALELKKV